MINCFYDSSSLIRKSFCVILMLLTVATLLTAGDCHECHEHLPLSGPASPNTITNFNGKPGSQLNIESAIDPPGAGGGWDQNVFFFVNCRLQILSHHTGSQTHGTRCMNSGILQKHRHWCRNKSTNNGKKLNFILNALRHKKSKCHMSQLFKYRCFFNKTFLIEENIFNSEKV